MLGRCLGKSLSLSDVLGLPLERQFDLVTQRPLGCVLCQGCLLQTLAGGGNSWVVSQFGACSPACGVSYQTRTVECQRYLNFSMNSLLHNSALAYFPARNGATVADSECDSFSKPPTSQACHLPACPEDCTQLLSCQACLISDVCGWCDGRCVAGDSVGPANAVCNNWTAISCVPDFEVGVFSSLEILLFY